jgi:predicted Zn-dependent protease
VWRTARAVWWVGHTTDDTRVKRNRCLTATQLAERAIDLQPDRVEGHIYYAVAIGEYATTIGVNEVIWKGVGPKLEHAALRAYALDKDYDEGASMTTLGRYYSMLPWPLQDLQQSRRYLEELRQSHPHALIGRFYLAETYYKLGEHTLALHELEYVVSTEAVDGAAVVRPPPRDLAAQRLAQWFPEVQAALADSRQPASAGEP